MENNEICSLHEEDDEDVCRICRNPGYSENPLRYPCACRGTIKYVHQDCLLLWLNRRNISQCEICKHTFSFVPVYAENAPERLSLHEFLIELASRASRMFKLLLRFTYLLFVWLVVIPLVTHWACELAWMRSYGEVQRFFLSHVPMPVIVEDCLHGFVDSLVIAYIILGVNFMRVFFALLRRGPPGLVDGIVDVNGDGEDAGGRRGIAKVGQMVRRYVEILATWWEQLVVRLLVHIRPMLVGIAQNAPLHEFGGFRKLLFLLDDNAFAVFLSNICFFLLVVFLPLSLGRIIDYLLWLFSSATRLVMLSSVIPLTESALPLANINASNTIVDGMQGQVSEVVVEMLYTGRTGLEVSNSVSKHLTANLLNRVTIGSPNLSDTNALLTGYMVISSFAFFYLGIVLMMRRARGQALTMWLSLGFSFITVAVPSHVRKFFAAFRQFLTMVNRYFTTVVKVASILLIKLGVFPLMCGWWLDVCTLRMFGRTIAQRVDLFVGNLFAVSLIYWIVGICYMFYVFSCMRVLQEVVRKGVFHFLQDIANPNYNLFHEIMKYPVHKHVSCILLSVGIHGSLIVMLVHLPVKLAMLFVPSLFPLDMSLPRPVTVAAIFAEHCMFKFGIPCTLVFFYPSATTKTLVHKWLTLVSSILSLSVFLLPRPEGNGVQGNRNAEPARQHRINVAILVVFAINEGSIVSIYTPETTDAALESGDEQADPEFVLRIFLLLVLAWMTMLIFSSIMMAVPVLLGRALFNASLLITLEVKYNDVYTFTTGSCIMRAIVIAARHAMEHVQTGRSLVLLDQIWKWTSNVFKGCALFSIWIFVIPVLFGLLFDLMVMVPIRVPLDESPVFLLLQDWILGVVFLHIWTGLVVFDNKELFVARSWRVKLERVRNVSLQQLPALWVLQEILIPIITKLLTALCVPYVFTRGLFPFLGFPLVVNSAVHRFAWPACLALCVIWFCAKIFHLVVIHLHNSIRDDRYRIGQRVCNYGEDSKTLPN